METAGKCRMFLKDPWPRDRQTAHINGIHMEQMERNTVCGLKDTIMENAHSSENISIGYKTEVLL